jgi:CHAT domain
MMDTPNNKIRKVKLELLRPGPAHNQLLSPLTPYIALCGEDGPVTVQMPFEHRQLLIRLRRLRYESSKDPAKDEQRQAEVRDMGEAIGRVLSQIPALLSELGEANVVENSKLVHLSLSLSAFELGLIPFEFAIGMDGFPSSGSPLFLQTRAPISITREIRRGHPLPINWNRPPRILFAFAGPEGLFVPAQAHLQALRAAIEPWVKIRNQGENEKRVEDVKKILTVLPNASLKQIREECATTEYTHIHILAHGAPLENSGEKRYGVALCDELDQSKDIVDGERLAIALTARDASGKMKFCPTLVTLATCDSGNIESVLTPGGSIAHELHAAGIPWVIASQFPLWMRASSIAAEILYGSLLNGCDPRRVLYDLRQRLRTDSSGTHDWASIVAYATVPEDFEQQIEAFRDKQIRAKLEAMFDRIDELVGANAGIEEAVSVRQGCDEEIERLCKKIRDDLKKWREEPEAVGFSKVKAERLGMSAASEKRIGIAYSLLTDDKKDTSKKAYEAAREFYREALKVEPYNHWVITQYLSIAATPLLADSKTDFKALAKDYVKWWAAARQIAEWQLHKTVGVERAWALGTLAELALLGVAYGGQNFRHKQAEDEIIQHCSEMLRLLGSDAFAILSTRRQFGRYIRYWKRDEWEKLAHSALRALGDKSSGEPSKADPID